MAMQKVAGLLAEWHNITPEMVERGRIKTDKAFQPRNTKLVPLREQKRLERESARHVEYLVAKLADGKDLDALLIAHIDSVLYLIDGHHRLQAYRKSQRSKVPTRIRNSTWEEAIMASKAVNCSAAKLPMHSDQRLEAAWQYIALRTDGGKDKAAKGESLRSIGSLFGISHSTVGTMLKALSTIKGMHFFQNEVDIGTQWPHWKQAKGRLSDVRGRFAKHSELTKEGMEDEKRAARLGDIIDTDGMEAFMRALWLLGDEIYGEIKSAAMSLERDDVQRTVKIWLQWYNKRLRQGIKEANAASGPVKILQFTERIHPTFPSGYLTDRKSTITPLDPGHAPGSHEAARAYAVPWVMRDRFHGLNITPHPAAPQSHTNNPAHW